MKKIGLLFLFSSVVVFSCSHSSETKEKKIGSTKVQTKVPVDTLIPEKIDEEKLKGQYVYYYGNWGYELEIGNKRKIQLTFDGDTENTIWRGRYEIKNDTLIAKYNSCIDREIQFLMKDGKEYTKHEDYKEDIEGADSIGKFIVVKGKIVLLDHVGPDDFFSPEIFQTSSDSTEQ